MRYPTVQLYSVSTLSESGQSCRASVGMSSKHPRQATSRSIASNRVMLAKIAESG